MLLFIKLKSRRIPDKLLTTLLFVDQLLVIIHDGILTLIKILSIILLYTCHAAEFTTVHYVMHRCDARVKHIHFTIEIHLAAQNTKSIY